MRWPRLRRQHFDSQPKPIDLMFAMMQQASGTAVSRESALSVPAVRRGRNMICSIATLPLEQHGPDNTIVDSALLRQIDPDIPNVVTLAQTVEDLLLSGESWWEVTLRDFAGFPAAARHLDVTSVSVNPPTGKRMPAPLPSGIDPRDGVVWVDGQPVPGSAVIRFDSPNPPVLKYGGREIRRAILLDKAASMYADDPRPLDYFSPADGADPVDDEEVKVILAQWQASRKSMATGWVPNSMAYHSVDSPSPADLQLVELQKQVSLDIANALGIDPEDLGISTTSRTYANDVDRRRNKLNEVLAPYMSAITSRLSMGDVTRRGYTVVFNTTTYLLPNPTERWATYSTAKGLGAMTVEEIRLAEGMPPLPADVAPPPPEADKPVDMTFDNHTDFTLDMTVTNFSVDTENRIIEGLAVPYGQYGTKGGITFRFDSEALQWEADSPGRVKLVYPRHGEAVGKAIQLRSSADGLLTRFKVGRGAEGDKALMSAEDGVFDGLSIGVDFDPSRDTVPDPQRKGALLVRRADLRHVALTDAPVFDNARVTSVAASRNNQGGQMADTETTEPSVTAPDPVPEPAALSAEQVTALMSLLDTNTEPERPTPVNPIRTSGVTFTNEPVPYQFDRGGNFVPGQEYDFSTDLHEMSLVGDIYGHTEAGKRAMGLMRAEFAAPIQTTNVPDLNPTIQRPDMYVDQRDFKYPIYASIDKGAPPNGVQPFAFPKFNSSASLTADHVQGTEPTGGDFTTTSQTVTPTPISGKVHITREVWDMGGNPAVSTLIFNQMVRSYREGLESAAATFLNTLTAATDINLGVAATDAAFTASWEAAVAGLNFVRGYDFSVMVVDQTTFLKGAGARDTTGRPFWPQIGPTNANGTTENRFTAINAGGVTWLPSWALPSTAGVANNSWLYDPTTVHAWTTPPQRFEFPGATQAGAYAPVAFVDLAIWGYKAFANSDIAGVRQVIYDSV